jgi:hypothetical protein
LYNQELTAAFNNTLENSLKVCGVFGCIAFFILLLDGGRGQLHALAAFYIYICISWLAEHNT